MPSATPNFTTRDEDNSLLYDQELLTVAVDTFWAVMIECEGMAGTQSPVIEKFRGKCKHCSPSYLIIDRWKHL